MTTIKRTPLAPAVARLLVAVGLLTAGCTAATPTTTPTPPPDGQALYERFCGTCHGEDGRSVASQKTSNLNNQVLLTTADDDYLAAQIARGRPGGEAQRRGDIGTKMPVLGADHGGPLGDDEIAAIVAHIRQWQTEPAVELPAYTADGDPARGAEVYAAQCAECHGEDGWSADAPSLAGLTFQDTSSDAFIRHTTVKGRPGTDMPAFDALSDDDLDALIAYVRTLGE